MFAANRNIAPVQRNAQASLDKLRFSPSEDGWYRGSGATIYTLDAPPDGSVGYGLAAVWRGGLNTGTP